VVSFAQNPKNIVKQQYQEPP